jgi:hypothetical protein
VTSRLSRPAHERSSTGASLLLNSMRSGGPRPATVITDAGNPHVVPLLVTRPQATPLALRPLGTLRPLEDVPTLHIYRALPGFLHGHILNPGNSPATPARPAPCPASACTGCRPARSPCCAASPASSPPAAGCHGQDGDPAGRFPHAPQLLQQAESGQHPGNVRGLNVRIGSAAPIRAGNLGLGSPAIGPRHDRTGSYPLLPAPMIHRRDKQRIGDIASFGRPPPAGA